MRSVVRAISPQNLASGYGAGDRVTETLEDAGVALHTRTAESEPPEYREDLAADFRQPNTCARSNAGTRPAAVFWEEESGRELSGALRAAERAVIEGDSPSLVHE